MGQHWPLLSRARCCTALPSSWPSTSPGIVNEETVERVVFESYTALAPHGDDQTHLAETRRAVRARPPHRARPSRRALIAKRRPEVLFVCVQNSGRSQMAAALHAQLARRPRARALGRIEPASSVKPAAWPGAWPRIGARPRRGVPEAADRRCRPGRRRGDHDGLRRRLPDLPGQALPRLGARRPGRSHLDGVRASATTSGPCRDTARRDRRGVARVPRAVMRHRERHRHRIRPRGLHRRGLPRSGGPRTGRARQLGRGRRRARDDHRGRELPRVRRRHHGPRPHGADARPGGAIRRTHRLRRCHRGRAHRRREDHSHDQRRRVPRARGCPGDGLRLSQAWRRGRGAPHWPRRLLVRDLRRVLLQGQGHRRRRRRRLGARGGAVPHPVRRFGDARAPSRLAASLADHAGARVREPEDPPAWNAEVLASKAPTVSSACSSATPRTGTRAALAATGLFIAIGHDPRSELVAGQVDSTPTATSLVEHPSTRTNLEGVFACGDLVDKRYRQAITAAGTGCAAPRRRALPRGTWLATPVEEQAAVILGRSLGPPVRCRRPHRDSAGFGGSARCSRWDSNPD